MVGMQARPTALLVPLAAALLLGCATPATGPRAPAVAVRLVPWRGAGETARDLAAKPYLKLDLQRPEALLEARAGPPPGDPAAAAEVAARQALARSRELYRQLKLAEAVSLLTQARSRLGRHAATRDQVRLLGRLSFELALNHLALQDQQAAVSDMASADNLGFRGPEPGAVSPEVEAFVTRVRGQLSAAPRGTLAVQIKPAGGTLLLDGKPAPARVEVTPGLHHLRAQRPGHQPRGLLQQVAPGKQHRLTLDLEPIPPAQTARLALERYRAGAAPTDLGLPLARALGPDTAVLEVRNGPASELSGRLHWTGKQAAAPPPRPECTAPARAPLADCLGPRLYRLAAGRTLEQATPPPSAPPVYKRWWFWTLVGAGVAAGAGAGVGIYYATRGWTVEVE
jgi:hypothetical protein